MDPIECGPSTIVYRPFIMEKEICEKYIKKVYKFK